MKKTLCIALSLFLAAAMVLTMTGCGNELSGTWSSITGERGVRITFSNSGMVTFALDDYRISGTYTAAGGVIIMNLTDGDGDKYQITMNYYIDGKKLYLENENGDVETFSK